MSDAESKAVFLSYASQDAEAARRICEALRNEGIEVWFDENALRGGDSWDASIRRQIRDCALFIPIVSASTQARREGYFRLEWKLADERTHLIAEGLPFANGVLPWQGGVIVTAAPDIWFLKDTDGDGKADVKEKLFTGFKEGNPQLRVNHPTLGIDGWIYVANGLSGGDVRRADKDDSAKIPIPARSPWVRPSSSSTRTSCRPIRSP